MQSNKEERETRSKAATAAKASSPASVAVPASSEAKATDVSASEADDVVEEPLNPRVRVTPMARARPSPVESASVFDLGTVRTGRDGNEWVVVSVQTKNGPVRRWQKGTCRVASAEDVADEDEAEEQVYLTHDNGGRPFKMVVRGNRVSVYKRPIIDAEDDDDHEDNPRFYTDLVTRFDNVQRVFVGQDPTEPDFLGNSNLLHLSDNTYVFVGDSIFSFTTSNGDAIVEYWSLVGNSDVPYPVALGGEFAYFMLEGPPKYVARNLFRPNVDWADAYMDFYGCNDPFYGNNRGLSQGAAAVQNFRQIQRLLL